VIANKPIKKTKKRKRDNSRESQAVEKEIIDMVWLQLHLFLLMHDRRRIFSEPFQGLPDATIGHITLRI
jgi:hypothetical protein